MTDAQFDDFDHASHMGRAFELAREAVSRGNRPFGSVLVADDEIIMVDSYRVETADDLRRHPELHLATRAWRELSREARARTVMYTSTEPCAMCAGGIRRAGLGRVVFSVSGEELARFTGRDPGVDSAAILEGVTELVGPFLGTKGRQIHENYYGPK